MVFSKRVTNAKSEKFSGLMHKRVTKEVRDAAGPAGRVRAAQALPSCQRALRLRMLAEESFLWWPALPPVPRACAHILTDPCRALQKSKASSAVKPVLLGFFVFVVVGSGNSRRACWKLPDLSPRRRACQGAALISGPCSRC